MGLARSRSLFAMTQHFTDVGDTPFWHLCAPKGAVLTSLRGGVTFAPLPAGFRRLLWPPLFDHRLVTCFWTCKCNQLHGLCYKKGFFHGMQHSYRCSLLTWKQLALEHCDTPDLHRDHGSATLWCGRWSLVIKK